mgnify:CR=1 FL=1
MVPAPENVVSKIAMLSDAKIRAAKARDKAYKLTDSHRLYLLVKPNGSKLWKWNYSYDGRQKTMAFGIYPMVSLLDARAKRDEARAQLDEGRDPSVVKKLKIEANIEASRNTFELIAREWHENSKSQWAAIHADDVIRSLERDVFPAIGALPISKLLAPKIFEVLKSIEDRGAIETAKRVRRRISAVFVYGIVKGVTDKDPAEKLGVVLKPLRKGRQPAITDLPRLCKMIKDAEEDYARLITRLALRLLALTAVRPNEIRGARWEEFEDLDAMPLWRIPAARMKGDLDRKEEIGGDHLVPLAPQSVDVLRAFWPLTGRGPLLFPSNRGPGHASYRDQCVRQIWQVAASGSAEFRRLLRLCLCPPCGRSAALQGRRFSADRHRDGMSILGIMPRRIDVPVLQGSPQMPQLSAPTLRCSPFWRVLLHVPSAIAGKTPRRAHSAPYGVPAATAGPR